MKYTWSFFLALIWLTAWTQSIDNGIGGLKIDQQYQAVKKFLVPADIKSSWLTGVTDPLGSPAGISEMVTAFYTVNLAQFPAKAFFGLPIVRIEAGFEKNEEDAGEDVHEFVIFMKAPDTKAFNSFLEKVQKAYGYTETFAPEQEIYLAPVWFTEITLLSIYGPEAAITINGQKYIRAHFVRAYGG